MVVPDEPRKIITGLTAAQADGLACVVRGLDYLRTRGSAGPCDFPQRTIPEERRLHIGGKLTGQECPQHHQATMRVSRGDGTDSTGR